MQPLPVAPVRKRRHQQVRAFYPAAGPSASLESRALMIGISLLVLPPAAPVGIEVEIKKILSWHRSSAQTERLSADQPSDRSGEHVLLG